ncbi:hypothetical protein V6N13_114186 [Hibiscus sabdariffa]|uniref:SH3 domain-containing protein n=1 Tax=Hibiscus sabdariffa TaxID=183260 RepID=A0ABR2U109_9ROSI
MRKAGDFQEREDGPGSMSYGDEVLEVMENCEEGWSLMIKDRVKVQRTTRKGGPWGWEGDCEGLSCLAMMSDGWYCYGNGSSVQ